MFLERRSSWAGQERLIMEELVWSEDGTLLITSVQEGVLRLKKEQASSSTVGKTDGGGGGGGRGGGCSKL